MTYKRYEHDCDTCTFLGVYKEDDLYFCSQVRFGNTVIARHGNEPGDYSSGLCFADDIESLGVAKMLAQEAGLLSK